MDLALLSIQNIFENHDPSVFPERKTGPRKTGPVVQKHRLRWIQILISMIIDEWR